MELCRFMIILRKKSIHDLLYCQHFYNMIVHSRIMDNEHSLLQETV